MPKIKICGIRTMDAVRTLNELLPDYAGFILTDRFWRYIPPETVAELRAAMDPAIRTVGVFVNETPEYIARFVNNGLISVVQLHGSEDNAYIAQLRTLIGTTPIIKAFKIRTVEDVRNAEASDADSILLDNGTGTGETFDWSVLRNGTTRPYFLAGGLGSDNVADALTRCAPFAVDVSSGVETDRVKDPAKMRRFVNTVREFQIDQEM